MILLDFGIWSQLLLSRQVIRCQRISCIQQTKFIELWEMESAFASPDKLSGVHAFLVQQTMLLMVSFHQEFQLRRRSQKVHNCGHLVVSGQEENLLFVCQRSLENAYKGIGLTFLKNALFNGKASEGVLFYWIISTVGVLISQEKSTPRRLIY